MTTVTTKLNPVLKVRDMNGSKQVTIVSKVAKQLQIDGETYVEEVLNKDGTLLLRFIKEVCKK